MRDTLIDDAVSRAAGQSSYRSPVLVMEASSSIANCSVVDAASLDRWVGECWMDMRRRHSAGLSFATEDYLSEALLRQAAYSSSIEAAIVDLIYGEFALRRESGEDVTLEDYIQRFPSQAAPLRRQLAFERALTNNGDSEDTDQLPHCCEVPPTATPAKIGKYVVIAPIASGGQADVYRAVHPDLNIEVAIKIPKHQDPSQSPESLKTEAHTLASLSHPNLVRILDLNVEDGSAYLVSEYVRGRTLEQFASDQPPSLRESAGLIAKIARGLATAHRCGIVHLDVKPRNVLIDATGEPRLIDFGLAIYRESPAACSLEAGDLRGTLQFMSPEQAQGNNAAIGPRADIFSLGSVLFFLLTGQPPYERSRWAEALRQARTGEWQRRLLQTKDIPRSLRRICCKAMDPAVDRRFNTADELANELERYLRTSAPRWHWKMASAACITVAALCIGGRFYSDSTSSISSQSVPSSKLTPSVASEPLISTEVWNDGRYLRLVDSTPLTNGDRLRIEAKVPADLHASLFLLTSGGELKLLNQVAPKDGASLLQGLHYPSDPTSAAPLSGPRGTEVLIVCGSRDREISSADVSDILEDTRPWPHLPEMSVLLADARDVHWLQRGRDFGSPVSTPNPEGEVSSRLKSLRAALAERFDCFEAVAFYHGE